MLRGKYCSFPAIITCILLTALLLLSGCAVDREGAMRESSATWVERIRELQAAQQSSPSDTNPTPLARLLDEIDRRPLLVQTATARMTVEIVQTTGKTISLNGQYMGDAFGNFRLRLTGIFGVVGLELCCKDGQITGCLPTKKIAFQCTREQIEKSSCLELILLSRVGQARELFFPRAWDSLAGQRRVRQDHSTLNIDVFASGAASPLRRILVDPEPKTIIAQRIFKSDGLSIGQIGYAKFVPCSSIAEDAGKGDALAAMLPVPTAIHIATPKVSFEFTLESLTINRKLDSKSFDLKLPDSLPLIPLSDLSREGCELFCK